MAEMITASEFARREGCDEKQVRRACEKGLLTRDAAKLLDASQVKSGWWKANRRTNLKPPSKARTKKSVRNAAPDIQILPGETAEDAADRILSDGTAPPSGLARAILSKENYTALLKQLEYDTKSGAVVLVSDVAAVVAEEYSRVRTRLLAIPAEKAPDIHRLKTVAQVQEYLQRIIVEALEELTRDEGGSTG